MKLDQQLQARDMYLYQGKTQTEIAEILQVERKTVYNWIQNGRWMEMKVAARQAPTFVLQDLYNHIDQVNKKIYSRDDADHCPTMQEVDMLRKLVMMTKAYEKRSIGAYIQSYEELTEFAARTDINLAKSMVKCADQYIKGTLYNKNFLFKEEYTEVLKNIPPDNTDSASESSE